MTRKELIALTKEVRDKIKKLHDEITYADDDLYLVNSEEGESCHNAFRSLIGALEDFAKLLEGKKDLPLDALVMCKRTASELVGWRVEYYVERGATKPDIISDERRDDWLYVVPLRYFHPTSTDWRPEEKYNWANFGEEEE